MVDYLTYYYLSDRKPFQSISALPDEEAIQIMKSLCDDSKFGSRFKEPEQYLKNRRGTEKWLYDCFVEKGGKPQNTFPISMVLGSSKWLVANMPDPARHAEIHIPLSLFSEQDVSFTYPDSMVSRWFDFEKPAELYQPDLHGQVFTLSEIMILVKERGMPEEDWEPSMPEHLGSYIEAQVWNHDVLKSFVE